VSDSNPVPRPSSCYIRPRLLFPLTGRTTYLRDFGFSSFFSECYRPIPPHMVFISLSLQNFLRFDFFLSPYPYFLLGAWQDQKPSPFLRNRCFFLPPSRTSLTSLPLLPPRPNPRTILSHLRLYAPHLLSGDEIPPPRSCLLRLKRHSLTFLMGCFRRTFLSVRYTPYPSPRALEISEFANYFFLGATVRPPNSLLPLSALTLWFEFWSF